MNIKQSRREFLLRTSAAAGGLFLGSHFPDLKVMAQQGNATSDTVRLGIIGVGSRGTYLFRHINQVPGVEVAAVCDDYPVAVEKGIQLSEGKAEAFSDYRKLLEKKDLDAVVITTPLFLHASMAIDALRAGKHVFCEKAMAKTPQECYDMFQAQKETGKILLIGHQRMFNPRYLKAFELIKNGQIGDVTQVRAYWHRNNDWRRKVPELLIKFARKLYCFKIKVGKRKRA